MKTKKKLFLSVVLFLSALTYFNTSQVLSQWYLAGIPAAEIFSFPNVNTGFVTSGGIVKKTTNAGVSWQTVLDLQLLYGESLGLYFITPEKGWLSADDDKLYQTNDGGISWDEIIDMGSSGRQIFFADQLHGWARNYSNFYRTTDGGQSWSYHNFGFYATVCNLFFINSNTGWIGNYNNLSTTVQKTTNGGLTWIPKQNLDVIFYDIHFVNELTGWGAGYAGQVFKTTDGGESWNEQNSNVGHTIDKIFMINAMTGWVGTDYSWGGTSFMSYTTNGGNYWNAVVKPENLRVTDLKFFGTTGIGYLIMGGKLFKTFNNGIFIPTPVPATITLAEEGFYNTSTNKLNIRDTVRVYLRDIASPFNIVDSGKAVIDSLYLSGSVMFSNALSGTYYVVVKHRNCIETWSKSGGETYTRGSAFSYDFTSAISQAYGNNQILRGTKYCIFSGDVNNEGVVDLIDIVTIFNDAAHFVTGYVNSDVNGNKFVDVSDLILAYNNSANFVTVRNPIGRDSQSLGLISRGSF